MRVNPSQPDPEGFGRFWRFADCEVDERSRELRVRGKQVPIETKPLDVLIQLLSHPGKVLTKEKLLTAVWADVEVVDGSLATLNAYQNARSAVILSGNGTNWNPWTTYRIGAYSGQC